MLLYYTNFTEGREKIFLYIMANEQKHMHEIKAKSILSLSKIEMWIKNILYSIIPN